MALWWQQFHQRSNERSLALSADQWDVDVGGRFKLPTRRGVYGVLGTPAQATFPARAGALFPWIDGSGQSVALWRIWRGCFGSVQAAERPVALRRSQRPVDLDEQRKHDGTIGQLWRSGHATASTCPAPARVSWVDSSGNLWLFGGIGFAASGGFGPFERSVALRSNYRPMDLDERRKHNQSGAYGPRFILGTAAAGNVPEALCQCLLDRR